MKKTIRTIAGLLLATQLNAQDTTCVMVTLEHQVEFDYRTKIVVSSKQHPKDYKAIMFDVYHNEVLCLYLFDEENVTREVIIRYPDGRVDTKVFSSENNGMYSPIGPFVVEVSKPRL